MTEKKQELLFLGADLRLEHLITAEAHELCISVQTERSAAALTTADTRGIRLVLWDMDTVTLPDDLALPAELPIYGITAQRELASPPSPPLTKLWHRPLSVDRLRAELLRVVCAGQPAHAPDEGQSLAMYFESDALTLHIGENVFTLTEKEAAIMSLLLENRGKAVTKEALRAAIAEKEEAKESVSNKVEVYLCHLRRKLEQPLGLRLFATVRGQGYRLENSN